MKSIEQAFIAITELNSPENDYIIFGTYISAIEAVLNAVAETENINISQFNRQKSLELLENSKYYSEISLLNKNLNKISKNWNQIGFNTKIISKQKKKELNQILIALCRILDRLSSEELKKTAIYRYNIQPYI